MKRTRIIAYIFNLYSMSAVAGYDCVLKLAHNDDLYKTVAEKTITIEQGAMRSGSFGTLLVESEQRHKRISLDINAVMSGWKGEEDASFVVLRRTMKRSSNETQTVSEVMTVQGDEKMTGWFDAYKLDIKCQVTGILPSED
jgi:hypothetical protein